MSTSKRVAHSVGQILLILLILLAACGERAGEASEFASDTIDRGEGEADGPTDKALSTTPYQAELSSSRGGCQVVNATATSPAYVDYGGVGTWVEWNNIRVDYPGRYKLTFRYANGAPNPRRSDALVNGKKAGEIAFEKTGAWGNWANVTIEANLIAGNNTVRIVANTSTGGPNLDWMSVASIPRGLYTWTFGGLDTMGAPEVVALLRSTGYAGIVVDTARSGLLQSYLTATENTPDFQVVAAYVAVNLTRGEAFSDTRHRAAIDALSQAGEGDLWITFRDDNRTKTTQAITNLVRGIVDYARARGVRVIWYPHNNNVYATTAQAMTIVNAINQPNFGVALNLIHELRAGNSTTDGLRKTLLAAGGKLFSVTLCGAASDLTTIKALHESSYNLTPFIQLIQGSTFAGPVGFLNHTLTGPQTYLPRSLSYWKLQW